MGKTTDNKCRDCWAFRKCKLCVASSDNGDSLSKEKRLSYCKSVKKDIDVVLKYYVMMHEIKNHSSNKKISLPPIVVM